MTDDKNPFNFQPIYPQYLGTRGPLSNSGTHFYDKSTNVLFFTEMQKNSMTCWNAKSPMMPSNIHNVHKDDTKLIYPADLNVTIFVPIKYRNTLFIAFHFRLTMNQQYG